MSENSILPDCPQPRYIHSVAKDTIAYMKKGLLFNGALRMVIHDRNLRLNEEERAFIKQHVATLLRAMLAGMLQDMRPWIVTAGEQSQAFATAFQRAAHRRLLYHTDAPVLYNKLYQEGIAWAKEDWGRDIVVEASKGPRPHKRKKSPPRPAQADLPLPKPRRRP